jgi:hypothetical protein
MAQVVEHQPNKCKAPSSTPVPPKNVLKNIDPQGERKLGANGG